ncbi:MAG: putative DNA binding domain-containing protein [Bacteroidales bacterium]|nr:putative DNA binding domain-containing protein [Bacteroidales bacterium]
MRKEFSTWDKKSLKTIVGKTRDFNELAKDCVAFANFKGGHLHIGIEDEDELPPSSQKRTIDIAEGTVKRLNELTINVGISQQIVTAENGGEYLDLTIHQSRTSVASTTNGKYFMRDNDKSRTLLPDELIRLVGDKPSYCWETKVTLPVKWEDADSFKLQRFERDIRNSDRVSQVVKEKSIRELLEYYLMIDDQDYLTNLGILWVGKRQHRARLLYSPVIQYIKYDDTGEKVFKKTWDDYEQSPQELLESIWLDIPEWRESNEVSEGLWRVNIPAFDEKVVRP